jgi:glutamine synthetase
MAQAQTPQDVLNWIKNEDIKLIDLKFIDMLGTWQHLTITPDLLSEDSFTDGVPFDGSSIRGWKSIHESDMAMRPDPLTAWIDPFMAEPTLSLVCTIIEPRTGELYDRCPRAIAQKAVDFLTAANLGDVAYFGPEPEFYIFDEARFEQTDYEAFYRIDSGEARWNFGRQESSGNLGHKMRTKEGYFPVAPKDTQQDLRTEMLLTLAKCGVEIEKHHHEVGAPGQAELGVRFAPLIRAADGLMTYKYVCKNVAKKHGKTVTFMPKPVFGDNGTGMHTHQSIWKDGQPMFAGDRYAGLSQMGLHYIGGLLKHAPAILAFSNPTTNSYKRLVPGFEAPVNLAYSQGNRSACVRIPIANSPKAKRFEFRCPDPSCNPYLTFAVLLCAGIDGIKNEIDPGDPMDVDIYELSPEELAKVPSTPGSLQEALEALKADHSFLTATGVFTEDFINNWIEYKLENEITPLRMRPHPYEFALYYDA